MKIVHLRNISKEKFKESVEKSYYKIHALRSMGIKYSNGKITKEFDYLLNLYGVSTDHFDKGKAFRKYEIITKKCPVCGNEFETKKGIKKEKVTCSYSCANTHFRSGPSNPNWKDGEGLGSVAYRSICFHYHEKKCVVCGEEKIVAVHHYNEDHDDNSPENLIPLCPTHHQYVHSQYKDEVSDIIEKYINNWKEENPTLHGV